jgi:hypothetical protein
MLPREGAYEIACEAWPFLLQSFELNFLAKSR